MAAAAFGLSTGQPVGNDAMEKRIALPGVALQSPLLLGTITVTDPMVRARMTRLG